MGKSGAEEGVTKQFEVKNRLDILVILLQPERSKKLILVRQLCFG
jgi:hypothetical protein